MTTWLTSGAPEADSDADSIADPIDSCPTVPENFNGFEDVDGCPEKVPPRVCPYSLSPQIHFERLGQITLTSGALHELRKLALFLKKNPEARMLIRGHAGLDESHSEIKRQEIGLKRARMVRDYLIKGLKIETHRLEFLSMGAAEPSPCASTRERADPRDRRVDLRLLPAHSRPYEGPMNVE